MGIPNPDISKGDCYYYDGYRSDKAMLPCGNGDLGYKPCCQAGDVCLENSACYNAAHGVTYLAGCTDESYNDDVCPRKLPWENSYWVGLIYIGQNKWSPCHQKANPTLLASPDPCPMPTGDQIKTFPVAFTAPAHIPDVGRLPLSLGGTISWDKDHIPSDPRPTDSDSDTVTPFLPTSTQTSASAGSTATTSSVNPTSNTATATGSNPSPTNTGAGGGGNSGKTTGIIVGVVLGVLILGAIIAAFFYYRRRKQQDTAAVPYVPGDRGSKFNPYPPHHPQGPREPTVPGFPVEMPSPDMASTATRTFSELGSTTNPHWSGVPSELSAGNLQHPPAAPAFRRSPGPDGTLQSHIGDVFPNIGSPMIGGAAFPHPGPAMGPMHSQTAPILMTGPNGMYGGGHQGPDYRGSTISDGTIPTHTGTPPLSPGNFGSFHQYQRPDSYPGQPLPYQPYRPSQPAHGQEGDNKAAFGTVPTAGSGVQQLHVTNPDETPASLTPGPNPPSQADPKPTVFELSS